MNKKILAVSLMILILTVALTACKGKDKTNDDTTTENTDKVVQTVTVKDENGKVTNVEIFEDAKGEKYVTTVTGEKVPLTTDENGFADDVGYLITSKPSDTSSSTDTSKKTTTTAKSTESSSGQQNPEKDTSSASNETESGNHIIIADGDKTEQDVLNWEDF